MNGINEQEPGSNANTDVNMYTDPRLLIVTGDTKRESSIPRPPWMENGSFLVFRKLEQNIKAFEDLTEQWEKKGCESKEHMGAKLMGRWKSGKCHILASILVLVGIFLLAEQLSQQVLHLQWSTFTQRTRRIRTRRKR
jgi:hypothetical protein